MESLKNKGMPQQPEKPKPKIYLPEVREILENNVFLKWGLQQSEGINDGGNTLRHTQRVTNCGYLLAKHLAEKNNLSSEDIELFVEICLLHDIGKIKTPTSILTKPWKEFTEDDRKIVSEHVREGKKILKMQGCSPRVYNPVLLHHEFQEKSYPEIDIEAADFEDEDIDNAKLLAIIDVFDRLAFGASNIPPIPLNEASEKLKKQFKTEGDAEIIDFLISQYETIKDLRK